LDKEIEVPLKAIDQLYAQLHREAEASGYHLNPLIDDTKALVKGLLINEKRYGYWACPCRMADGIKEEDLDIICPCDYRDPDLTEYGMCFCGLYVSDKVMRGEKKVEPIPERRLTVEEMKGSQPQSDAGIAPNKLKYPLWRCKVCGYVCAREHPPETCPICKAKKERFELLLTPTKM
jgi:ferredoxin-thioredoxin reductase catalytic subunit